jgi:hypothetical protein
VTLQGTHSTIFCPRGFLFFLLPCRGRLMALRCWDINGYKWKTKSLLIHTWEEQLEIRKQSEEIRVPKNSYLHLAPTGVMELC